MTELRTIVAAGYKAQYLEYQETMCVIPIVDGVDLLSGVDVQDETVLKAAKLLDYTGPCHNAAELYEGCEDEDQAALDVAARAEELVKVDYEKVLVILSPEHMEELKDHTEVFGRWNYYVRRSA